MTQTAHLVLYALRCAVSGERPAYLPGLKLRLCHTSFCSWHLHMPGREVLSIQATKLQDGDLCGRV